MRQHRPTIFAGVPTLYASLLSHPLIGPGAGSDRLKRCISAGEALPADIGRRWRNLVGVDILDGIGSTEMLHIFISNRIGDVNYGTSGKPVPGYEAVVLGESDRPVPHGENGELVVKAPVRRTVTGTSATSRGGPSAASGPIPAIPTRAMRTGISATRAAATRC
jgi:acyl-coenzyme A synthetase/AMP-(fatty) acid ligase